MVFESPTLGKIEDVLARINVHPEYNSCVRKRTEEMLREEAAKHSYSMEQEEEVILTQREERRNLENIKSGWDYLVKHDINLTTLSLLGNIVEPTKHKYKNFRRVEILFGEFAGITPEQIPYQIRDLVKNLEDSKLHPISRSIEAHVEVVRIHPYEDGNGRVARLLQNFCLQQRGYPAVIIPTNERGIYIQLLKRTIRDRQNHSSSIYEPSKEEELLHEYLCSKMLFSVERLEVALRDRRRYEIAIFGGENGGIYSTAKIIRNNVNRRKDRAGVTVNLGENSMRKTKTLFVTGDVSTEELDRIITRCAHDFRYKYQLKCKDC